MKLARCLRMRTLASLVLFAMTIGCQAASPDSAVPRRPDAASPADGSPSDAGPLDPIILGPLARSTYWPSIPVHGRGPANILILAESEGSSLTAESDSHGDFCVDVALKANSVNMIRLQGVARSGERTALVIATVQQTGQPPDPPVPQPARNVAVGGSAEADGWAREGTPMDVIDGNEETTFEVRDIPFATNYVWVQLSERSLINRLVIRSPSDCILRRYTLLGSNRDAPPPPDGNGAWTELVGQDNGSGIDTFDLSPISLLQVALRFVSYDCSVTTGYHKVSEIEVWSVADQPAPTPRPPLCVGGQ